MKRIGLIVGGLAVVFLVITGLAADKKTVGEPAVTPEVLKLREQVKSLEGKLTALTERMDKLEKERSKPLAWLNLPKNGSALIEPPDAGIKGGFVDPDRPPKIGSEHEFNGWKYYMIPLSAEAK